MLLVEIADEALEILEASEGDDLLKAFTLGLLCTSAAPVKIWRFMSPPRIELEWIFNDERLAEKLAEAGEKFEKVTRSTRNIEGRGYPSIGIDWRFWRAVKPPPASQ